MVVVVYSARVSDREFRKSVVYSSGQVYSAGICTCYIRTNLAVRQIHVSMLEDTGCLVNL